MMAPAEPATDTSAGSNSHLFLVDGSGFIFRAFHALPPMSRADGTPTNAVFGFTNMLIKLVEDLDADRVAIVFDAARTSFRNDIYPEYKAQRPDAPEELVPQFGLIRDVVRAFNLPCIEMPGYEADDVIATYARLGREAGAKVTIVSSDKDLMQLVAPGVEMMDPMKNRMIGHAEVVEKFGVAPEKVVDVQALAGDSVDNVPGVPGIGVKTAAQLITEYGDLETLLERAEEIKQPKRRQNLIEHAELARISKALVTLKDDVAVADSLDDLQLKDYDHGVVLSFMKEQGFKRLTARFEAEAAEAAGEAVPNSVNDTTPEETQYELVQDLETLDRWIAEIQRTGIVAFDTETTSLTATAADMVGISLSTAPGRACYIPLRHGPADRGQGGLLDQAEKSGDMPKQIPFDDALARLTPVLVDPAILKIGHNIKYDSLVMARPKNGGVMVWPVDDTMSLSYVLEGGLHGHGLDELSLLHFDHRNIKYEEVCGKGKAQIPFSEVTLDKALDYAAEDADMTLRLHRRLRGELPKRKMTTVYETLERPLIPVLVSMERAGIKVDPTILRTMSVDFAKRMDDLADEIRVLAGEDFNIGSPKQLGEILFDNMGLPGGKKGKTGAYGTGADVLEDLAAQGHDLPKRVLDWRQISKLKSTYTDALVESINPETGRIHTSYSMTAASTGRLSSNDPNLQNIPVRTEEGRKIRTAFVPEAGHTLLSVDYSQIELRLVAHIAGIESLKEAFRGGIDIHAQTASEVFGVPLEQMDPQTRRNAKAINFGIIYGISSFGLARNIGCSQGEAKSFIDAYFARFPGIRDYMDAMKITAKSQGYVETLFGRRIHLPGIKDANPARRGFGERQAINAPIQGTAADIIKRAMVRMTPALCDAGLGARMLLQVHDELLFEVPDGELEATTAVVRQVMEGAAQPVVDLSVPLVADAGHGESWAAAH